MTEATLPLFPDATLGCAEPAAESLGRHGDVEYLDMPAREILNRNRDSRLPWQWTINPYRGCEFACSYCYARYTHGYLGLDPRREFESRIFVKRGGREALERKLRRASLRGESIAIGTVTDPYQPAERHHGVTRSLLEALRGAAGLDLSISTKSPLILRDLPLLAELDRRHTVTVNITVTTADPELARRLEPQAPDPRARLRALARLAAEGIGTRLFCMPILPRITEGGAVLAPLLEAARDAGAFDVVGAPLFLRTATRLRFWPWLRSEFPELLPVYRRLYARRSHLRRREREEVLAEFRRLRLRFGFPADRPGRV
ncbi:MAG: radical SAM protein [Thermoanaerobaculia bacterium]